MSTATAVEPRSDAEQIAWSIAAFICGGGLIGLVLYFTVVPMTEVLLHFLYFTVPLLALAAGVGLVSTGTLRTITTAVNSEDLALRIRANIDKMRANPHKTDDPFPAE